MTLYVKDVNENHYEPMRDQLREVLGAQPLEDVTYEVKLEIASDVFLTEGDKEAEKEIARSHFQDFHYTLMELESMKEWVSQFQQAIIFSTDAEKPFLMPTQEDFNMYYTVRGTRPKFMKLNLRFWRVIFYLISLTHQSEKNGWEEASVTLIHKYDFKPKSFAFQAPLKLDEERQSLGIPYHFFFEVLRRRFVIPSLSMKAATALMRLYESHHNCCPTSASDCWQYLEELDPNMSHECLHSTIRRILERRINSKLVRTYLRSKDELTH